MAPKNTEYPAPVEGRCNAEINKTDGTKDRCSRPEGHPTSHLGWIQRKANVEARKEISRNATAWRREHDPKYAEREAERLAKKVAKLEALAAELGYTVTAPKN